MTEQNEKQSMNRSNSDCNRCGFHIFNLYDKSTELQGGYTAILCVDCKSDWNAFVQTNDTFKKLVALHDAFNTVYSQTSADGVSRLVELAQLRIKETELVLQMFTVGEVFVTDVIEREQPAKEEPKQLSEEELAQIRHSRIASMKRRLAAMEETEELEAKRRDAADVGANQSNKHI